MAAGVFDGGGQVGEEVPVVAQGFQDPDPGDESEVAVLDAFDQHGDPAALQGLDDLGDGSGPGRAYGGASFAGALAAQGLTDEYCLAIQPVALGRGRSLFSDLSAALPLELIEARSFECGVVVHIYRPAEKASP